MAANTWTADRRLYLDKDGKVVEADDPTRASLLVPAGGTIPLERAQALGLTAAPEPKAERAEPPSAAQKAAAAKANKAKTPAENKQE
jgi:hypothetical protein